jgi:hypothetical protein
MNRKYTITSRAALVTGLSLLMGASLGCLGMEDTADPVDDDVESVESVDQEVAACDPNVGFTIKSGTFIKGSGSLPCAGTATVQLQRTIAGLWGKPLHTVTLNGAGDARTVQFNCAGTGRFTYRTIVTWRKISGLPGFKESNHIEVNC